MRLDAALVARGLARSRGHARDLVRFGLVRVDGVIAVKASRPVQNDDIIDLDPQAPGSGLAASWVSRAAAKLLGALDDLPDGGPALVGVRAADVGACTGGFTQVLLERGAAHVLAIDVGHGQLAAVLGEDPRVSDLSGRNVRDLAASDIGGPVDVLVADLSFISLTTVMSELVSLVRVGGDLLLLIKPQFEVGRAGLDGRGIVKAGPWRRDAVVAVLERATATGLAVRSLVRSRTPGQDGNTEYVAWLVRPDTCDVSDSWQAVSDISDLIDTVLEPQSVS